MQEAGTGLLLEWPPLMGELGYEEERMATVCGWNRRMAERRQGWQKRRDSVRVTQAIRSTQRTGISVLLYCWSWWEEWGAAPWDNSSGSSRRNRDSV